MEGPAVETIPYASPPPPPPEESHILASPPNTTTSFRQSSSGVVTAVCTDHWACEAYGRVCPNYAANAGRTARRALEKMAQDSQLIRQHIVGEGNDAHAVIDAKEFSPSELLFGRQIGKGGFSEVHEVRLLSSLQDSTPATLICQPSSGDDDEECKDRNQRYVVKFLRRSVMVDRKKFARGAADLVIEASLLSTLHHPNIIRLLGVTAGRVETNFASGKDHGFFLILDRLYDTLDHKIEGWKEDHAKYSSFIFRATHDPRGKLRRDALMERLQMARSLADAIRYLHERNVAFRDLKPENCGFAKNGVLKLFDFGLSKELKPHRRLADGTYQLTGNTGSRRYMAPEVARVMPYNLSVDSYSFGILLWEICALEKPFDGFTETDHRDLVVEGGERPEICCYGAHSFWPQELQDLLQNCWHQDLFQRPSFVYIENTIDRILLENYYGTHTPPSNGKDSRPKANIPKRSTRAKKRVGNIVRSASEKMPSVDKVNRSIGGSSKSWRQPAASDIFSS